MRAQVFLVVAVLLLLTIIYNLNYLSQSSIKTTRINQISFCDEGPYIWDQSDHLEGIGSTFQHRKPSLLAAHILNAKWIGNLTNAHDLGSGDQSAFFGLTYPECSVKELQRSQIQNPELFVTFNRNVILSASMARESSVLVFNHQELDQSHNFAVFDQNFRTKFHRERLKRDNPRQKKSEFWISLHFRWGDVASNDPVSHPNSRAGLGLDGFCMCVRTIRSIRPSAKVFFFAEGLQEFSACPILKSKKIQVRNASKTWKSDLDIMSQSQVLIGGSSSFFVLGSHLCRNCSVIHTSNVKFKKTDYESNLPQHLHDFYCTDVNCYIRKLKQILRSTL